MAGLEHRFWLSVLKVSDLLLVLLAFSFATCVLVMTQQHVLLVAFLSMRIKISNFLFFLVLLYIFHVCFSAFAFYGSHRLSTRRAQLASIFRATTLSIVLFVFLGALFHVKMITVDFILIFWLTTTVVLCGFRLALRFLLEKLPVYGKDSRNLLIFGTNPRGVAFAQRLLRHPEGGYNLLGFVDNEWSGIPKFKESGFELACDYIGLADYLRSNVVDEAIIYLPFASFYHHWSEVANLCAHHGVTVRLNSDTLGLENARWLAEEREGGPYIATLTGFGHGGSGAIKRLLDILVSSALLIALLPVLVAVALAIKLTSPGPLFFLQERVGLNKRRFRIWKFRTMVPNAEMLIGALESKNEVSGPVFKIKHDPRITPVGRFLRRSSLDELPQLFNVLKGDMSLVGPRPLPVRDYEGFSEDWQRRRFSVKPGITCLWQVNGRSGVSFEQWMQLDMQYLDEWSLWLDLKILAKTVPAVLKGEGAA